MKRKVMLGIIISCALAGTAATASARNFTNADLRGNYAELWSGFVGPAAPPSFGTTSTSPQSGTGILTADGNGNFTANVIFSNGGKTCSGTVVGTYVVGSRGRGTSTGTFTPDASAPSGIPPANYGCPTLATGTQDEAFTIVSPKKVDFISTDPDTVISGVAELQNSQNSREEEEE